MAGSKPMIELEKGWEFMSRGILKLKRILEGLPETQFSSEEYMMLYTTIYNMCTQMPPHDYSQQLYDKYKEAFEEYIHSTVLPSIMDKHDEFMLRELVNRWGNHKVMVRWLSRFFHYLDRYFISRRSLPSLVEVGHCCFFDLVYEELKVKVRAAAVSLIDEEREGEQIDRALLKNVLDFLVEIGMGKMDYYETDFEGPMLDDSGGYYSRKASYWIVEDSCPGYMIKAEECLKKERDRVSHYLHSSTEPKLVERVQNELLVVYSNQLLEKEHSGCKALLRDGKVDDLSRMYRLFCKIPKGLDPVGNSFREHIIAEGTALVQQAEDATNNRVDNTAGSQDQAFIRKVIDLHDKFMAYVTDCFLNNSVFHKALKEAVEVFCNKQVSGSSCAELLASFCCNILKKGANERLSDKVIEETLDKAVKLLAHISDKDLFAEFYRKLSRRLLLDRSVNNDYEKIILTKLKQQCGGQFTSKLEGMVTDLTLARDHQSEFDDYRSSNQNASPGIDLTVTVLTTEYWPTYKSSDLNLPAEMVKCVEVFMEYYQTKTKHRKLSWIYSLDSCNVNGKFDSKTIEMIVVTHQNRTVHQYLLVHQFIGKTGWFTGIVRFTQMSGIIKQQTEPSSGSSTGRFGPVPITLVRIVIILRFELYFEFLLYLVQAAALMLFNTADRLSYSEIKTQLNLADEDVVRVLQSLSCAKYKILTKTPNSRTVSPNDSFEFNSKFTDRMRRIEIPLPPVDERKRVVEDVDKDRRYAIDASIVRIMKSRKVLGLQQLVIDCVEQLSGMFKPDFKAIKKRIEVLISREYLERDKENPNMFRYVA